MTQGFGTKRQPRKTMSGTQRAYKRGAERAGQRGWVVECYAT